MPASDLQEATGQNVVVLRGVLSRNAVRRSLPSGDEIVAYEVTTRTALGTATVPVSAAGNAADLLAGTEVVVTGEVRRRYFRAGGATQSRTEVVASAVVPARQRARGDRAIREALAALHRE